MDYTLIHYLESPYLSTLFRISVNNFCSTHSISPSIFPSWSSLPSQAPVPVGYIYDKRAGSFFLLDSQLKVISVIHRQDAAEGLPSIGVVQSFEGLSSRCFRKINGNLFSNYTPFIVAANALFRSGKLPQFSSQAALSQALMRNYKLNFKLDQPGMQREIMLNPEKLMPRASDTLKRFLRTLRREEGKKLCLVTNSKHRFSEAVLSYFFGEDEALDFFDAVKCNAGKPCFYASGKSSAFEMMKREIGAENSRDEDWMVFEDNIMSGVLEVRKEMHRKFEFCHIADRLAQSKGNETYFDGQRKNDWIVFKAKTVEGFAKEYMAARKSGGK